MAKAETNHRSTGLDSSRGANKYVDRPNPAQDFETTRNFLLFGTGATRMFLHATYRYEVKLVGHDLSLCVRKHPFNFHRN